MEDNNFINPQIYKKANKRVHFKFHLAIWALAMLVIWIIFIFVFKDTEKEARDLFLKCSLFVTLLWTVILVFHYLFVYKLNSSMLEKEIKALQKEIKEQEAMKKALLEQHNKSQNQ